MLYENSGSSSKNIVLVTGASGFVGQHIVKLLQEKDENVDEIRCFDLVRYENKLGHKEDKPMQLRVGDIRNEDQVMNVCADVKWIINCAAVIESNDHEKYQSINVDGVNVLLNAAFHHNVLYFIQMSTADVCCGCNSNYYGAENTTSIPRQYILEQYSKSKYQAELIVGKANGKVLGNGYDRMRTIILRPTLLYGEQDKYNVPMFLRWAKDFRGTLIRINNIYTRLQWYVAAHEILRCYVGNAAWACIKAKERMVVDETLGSEDFFINDDTPIVDPYDFLKPFVEAKNYKISRFSIPYLIVQLFLMIFILLIKLIKPIYKITLPTRYLPSQIQYYCTTQFFNRNKATLRLDFKPIYDPDESVELSLEYYKNFKI